MSQKKYGSNLIGGTVLVILGLIFLLENLGFDVFKHIWKFWPVILIIWGWSKLRNALRSRASIEPVKPIESEKNESALK